MKGRSWKQSNLHSPFRFVWPALVWPGMAWNNHRALSNLNCRYPDMAKNLWKWPKFCHYSSTVTQWLWHHVHSCEYQESPTPNSNLFKIALLRPVGLCKHVTLGRWMYHIDIHVSYRQLSRCHIVSGKRHEKYYFTFSSYLSGKKKKKKKKKPDGKLISNTFPTIDITW